MLQILLPQDVFGADMTAEEEVAFITAQEFGGSEPGFGDPQSE